MYIFASAPADGAYNYVKWLDFTYIQFSNSVKLYEI